jgi:hypothetical protein
MISLSVTACLCIGCSWRAWEPRPVDGDYALAGVADGAGLARQV